MSLASLQNITAIVMGCCCLGGMIGSFRDENYSAATWALNCLIWVAIATMARLLK